MKSPPPPAESTCGRMIIDLIDNGTARPIPRITFDPVGRFTPGLINDHMILLAQEIHRAQTAVRYAQEHKQKELL